MSNEFFDLIDDLNSNDTELVETACRDAAILLERHVSKRYDDTEYKELFSNSFLYDFRLNKEGFKRLTDRLLFILETNEHCASIAAWGIGKTNDDSFSQKLIDSLRVYLRKENDEVVYQLIVSLENCGVADGLPLIEEVAITPRLAKSSEYAKGVLILYRNT
ncbi:MAG: hypothetical protein Q8L60_09515 [Gammaproteobacteria bacterium]|nr:hypothetical protein [Gammaproteobacteria bacterium]MDP2347609.1 hypothetical protein [Gammaproteobacteria bacterium]